MIYKISKNLVAVFSNSIIGSILAIIIVPIILSSVGQEQYGLIVLTIFMSVKNGILAIFIFGIQAAVVKYVAEYNAKDEYSKIDNLLGCSILFSALISASIVFTILGIKEWLFGIFLKVPNTLLSSYLDAFNYSLVSIFFQFINIIFLGYFEGLNRFFVSKIIDTLTSVIYFILVILCLAEGLGFTSIVKLLGIIHLITFFMCILALKVCNLRISPNLSFDRQLLVSWLKFCKSVFLTNLAAVSLNHSPKLIVSTLISPSALAIYDILSKMPLVLKSFVSLGNKVIMPVASELDATSGSQSINKLFTLGLKLNILVFIPFITAMALLSESVLLIWVGPVYVEYAHLMRILYLVPALSIFMSYGFALFMGINHRLGWMVVFGWSILMLSCFYWYFRIEIDGLLGLTIGRVFGLAITTPIVMAIFCNHFKSNSIDLLLRITAFVLLLLIPFLLLDLNLILFSFGSLLFLLVNLTILYILIFVVIYICLFNKDEHGQIATFLKKIQI